MKDIPSKSLAVAKINQLVIPSSHRDRRQRLQNSHLKYVVDLFTVCLIFFITSNSKESY